MRQKFLRYLSRNRAIANNFPAVPPKMKISSMITGMSASSIPAAPTTLFQGFTAVANGKKDVDARRVDPVVAAFRANVDAMLSEENVRLSVEERFLQLMELHRFASELRSADHEITRG